MRASAVAIISSAPMVSGVVLATSATRVAAISAPSRISRRRSPSVTIPSSASADPTSARPNRPSVITMTASCIEASAATNGRSSTRIWSRTFINRRRPSAPPGCVIAKSVSAKPRASISATEMASPRTRVFIDDVVGARFSGHASRSTEISRTMRAAFARLLPAPAVSAMICASSRWNAGRRRKISSVSPEFEIRITTSLLRTMPRSPWIASAGCKNSDGVPVDASVAAILRPIRPDLPIPQITT